MDAIDLITPFTAFMSQIGGRHVQYNFTEAQKRLMAHPISQMCIMFAMFYITTRRALIAFGLLVLYYLAVYVLLNEHHPWNMLSPRWLEKEGFVAPNKASSRDLYYENMSKLI